MGEKRGEEVGRERDSEENTQVKAGGAKTGAQVRSLGESLRGRGLDWETLGQSMGIAGMLGDRLGLWGAKDPRERALHFASLAWYGLWLGGHIRTFQALPLWASF